MRSTIRGLFAAAVIATVTGAATTTAAQGGIPLGSTTVVGKPDSLFGAFLVFLQAHGDSALSVDARHRTVQARVQGTDEPVTFVFTSRGDSTTIEARGKKGGMSALIFGLGAVNDWLEAKSKPDSTPR